jgi:hypothetical protein
MGLALVVGAACGGGDENATPDASIASPRDAQSATDGSLPDGMPIDAASPDAAPLDAASLDAASLDAAFDASPAPDASLPDATPPCIPVGDYVEADEAGNDTMNGGTPEASGLSIGAFDPAVTIGGCVGTDTATARESDIDTFTFSVIDDFTPIRLVLTWPETPAHHWIELLDSNGTLLHEGFANSGTTMARMTLPIGEYRARVIVEGSSPIASYPYQIEISHWTGGSCLSGPLTHTETDESAAGHRANDVMAVEWPWWVSFATTAAADLPDPTGITATAGSDVLIQGTSANVLSAGDDYRDRDTFVVTTGPTTEWLFLRASWPNGDTDLDVFMFSAAEPTLVQGGGFSSSNISEVMFAKVDPGTSYWLWIGAYNTSTTLPIAYDLTVCGR